MQALSGIDLITRYGAVMGLLGANGAGKTTLVRILTTLLRPDAGHATVAGYDVVRQAGDLRSVIGLAGQYAAVDENLTGRENLEMVGHLYHLPAKRIRARAGELLDRFDLSNAANRQVKTYSGGMHRRLDLAANLVANPRVLFLDEPTTGLDPRSRLALWDLIGELVHDGTSVLLTTQYMEEADRLADSITVIDEGRVVAEGTAEELKDQAGGDILQFRVTDRAKTTAAAEAVTGLGTDTPRSDPDSGEVILPVSDGTSTLAEAVRRLDAAGVSITDLSIRQPSLDDVFLALTGRSVEDSLEEG